MAAIRTTLARTPDPDQFGALAHRSQPTPETCLASRLPTMNSTAGFDVVTS